MDLSGLADNGLAADAGLCRRLHCQRLHCLRGLVEVEDPPDDGTQYAAVDEGTDLAKLVTAGAHEEEFVRHAEAPGLAADAAAEGAHHQPEHQVRAELAAERRIGWPSDPDRLAA